jgi:hypothetical protein
MNMLRDRSVLFGFVSAALVSAGYAASALSQVAPAASVSAPGFTSMESQRVIGGSRTDTQRAFRTPITLRVVDADLRDVLAHIESITRIRFEPVWADQTLAGLDPESLISLDVDRRPVREVLERILEQIGGGFDGPTWQIGDDGCVQIGPRLRLNERTAIVIYDLNDVLFSAPDFPDVPTIDLQSALQQSNGASQVPFQNTSEETKPEPRLRGADEIVDLITTFVEPEQWHRNGGEGALMRVWNNQLIVRAPRYVLRGIEGLL